MAQVDPDDDCIERWVIWHFRYDPSRRERRNVVVAAFDNEREWRELLNSLTEALIQAKAGGAAEAAEHLGGAVKPPGYAVRMSEQRVPPRGKKHRERKRRAG